MVDFLVRLTRWNEWHESKMPLFFIAGYSWLLPQEQTEGIALIRFAAWFVFAALYLAFGYALNDYSDIAVDRLAGKVNTIGMMDPVAAQGWLACLGIVGFTVLLPFYRERLVLITTLICYLFCISYSLPPVRFKERGISGLIVSAVAQRSLPMLVGMALFDGFDIHSWLLFSLFAIMGIRWIIVHQLLDFRLDELAQVKTFAQTYGYDRTVLLMKYGIFSAEILCLLAWFYLEWPHLPTVLGIIPIYILWLSVNAYVRRDKAPLFDWTIYGFLPLTDFYLVFWPFWLGGLLVFKQPIFCVIILGQFAWQYAYVRNQFGSFTSLVSASRRMGH